MNNSIERAAKSTFEKANALWIEYLNQIRFYDLCARLFQQDMNLEAALHEIELLKAFIGDPEHILGSSSTKHGEIAEHVQVNISNARKAILGLDKEYTFENVERLAPEDYLRNGLPVQSKFCNGLKHTLSAIKDHKEKYPSFLSEGGSYDIPRDQWEEMQDILRRARSAPSSLSNSEYSKLQAIRNFEAETGLSASADIHPSVANYDQVQQGTVMDTVADEECSIVRDDEAQREIARQKTSPSIKEGASIAGKSAAVEGGITFCLAVYEKLKSGKRLREFDEEDWIDIAKRTGYGMLKGGIRGVSVYLLTNYTQTSANLASAYTTAALGVAAQAIALKNGEITDDEFLINSEVMCLDIAVSTVSTFVGQAVIPVPILGGLVGNVVGQTLSLICQRYADEQERTLIAEYIAEMELFQRDLDADYRRYFVGLEEYLQELHDVCSLAFDTDVNVAFAASITLARKVHVPERLILKDISEIDDFFLG